MSHTTAINHEADSMTLKELSNRWGKSYTTVWELARIDKLPVPVFRVGRQYLVSRRAYDALMTMQHEPKMTSDKAA